MVSFLCVVSLVAGLTPPQTSWELKKLGTGGETYVSTDDQGTVYCSSHIPTQVYASRDWGATFTHMKTFPDSLGDVVVLALPRGRALMTYMISATDGFRSQVSSDYGKSWAPGAPPHGRPLDREWPAYDPATKTLYLIYSDGFIGGPKSKGIFLAESKNYGATWVELGRIDKEPSEHYPVDPHMVLSSDGKIYAFWTVTTDFNTIDYISTAVSTDHGKTFGHQQQVAVHDKSLDADLQERWMLGGLASFGPSTVTVFYTSYDKVTVDGSGALVLRALTRTSKDGGETFGPPVPAGGPEETSVAVRQYRNKKYRDENNPYFMQVMPWGCYDQKGRLNLVWMDDRDGQGDIRGNAYNKWHLRSAVVDPALKSQAASERVGGDFLAARPALDYLCCTADSKYFYASWTQNEGSEGTFDFSGQFYFARRPVAP